MAQVWLQASVFGMASKGKSKAVKKVEVSEIVDLSEGKDDANPYVFSEEILKSLLKKGYCVIDGGLSEVALGEILGEVKQFHDVGRFERPPDEVVEGLLGPGGSVRIVTVEPEAQEDDNSPIGRLDRKMLDMAGNMEVLSQQYFGFDLSTRSPSYLLEAGAGTEMPPAALDAKGCMSWLNIFQWHRFMCIFFLGPASGTLELQPLDDVSGTHSIPTRPGLCIVVRADVLAHRFSAGSPSYTLSSFFMQVNSDAEMRRKQTNFPPVPVAQSLDRWFSNSMREMRETIETQEQLEALAGREVTRLTNHMYHRGQQIAIRGCACRFGAQSSTEACMQTVLFSGCDAAECIPFMRWDNELYFRTEPQDGYMVRDTYTCSHGTFIEGIELFDHKFFGLSVNETRGMDPSQRTMLETCYETCYNSGFRKPTLMRSHMGVYTGGPAGELEWTWVPKSAESGALASTSGSPAILSNRISYTFGMNGPNYLMDMESASSLLAFQQAVDCCLPQRPQADSAIALGVDSILHPQVYMRLCWAGLMSTRGRCMSFDHTADGYIRGEGCGGVHVNPLLNEVDGEFIMDDRLPIIGIASGAYCNNSGKTASLTAPSGNMDQELIAGALKRAEISPLDVECIDPHASGSLLNDAVEVTALVKSYRAHGLAGEEMLGMSAVKSIYGNCKPAAGILAVLKTLISTAFGHMISSAHLMRVNPHMLLDDVPSFFASDHVPDRMNSAFYGISAKGIGGSNAHAIVWGKVDSKRVSEHASVLIREPISYWPGGGGELEDDAAPNRNYTIVGSWCSWSDPQPMEQESKGVYGYKVVLGEHAFERFQIWLDGDLNKVLHPKCADGPNDTPVYGPDKSADSESMHWMINGQPQYVALFDRGSTDALAVVEKDLQWVQVNKKDAGSPGDVYHIQLCVNGQYRLVTWEKVTEGSEGVLVPARGSVPVGKYYVTGSWNDWSYTEMTADASSEGLFYAEVQLMRESGGTFNIVRDQDERQTIYPQVPYANADDVAVLGPDEHGRAYYWWLTGKPGDRVRIELRRVSEEGSVSMKMAWQRLGSEKLSAEQLHAASRSQFYIVGTLGRWKKRHKMAWNGTCFVFEYALRIGNTESFQILMDGDWNLMLYPLAEDGAKGSAMKGPDEFGQGKYWTIGQSQDERSGRFEVQLHCWQGRPAKLTWVRK
uniref:Type I polyketide synthase n=1 Tax=Gambierdiscus excentricus TaxID=986170 RepID=A0A1S6K7Z8_9DINO|nr:type I polyketide synthase [Gambierdiscus excentricus]